MTLTSQLNQLLANTNDALQVIERVEALSLLCGDEVYQQAFLRLTGLRLSMTEARRIWRGLTSGARAATFAGQTTRQLRSRLLKAISYRQSQPAESLFAGTLHHTRLNHLLAEKRNRCDTTPLGVLLLAIDQYDKLDLMLSPSTRQRCLDQLAGLIKGLIRDHDCAFWPDPGHGVLLLTDTERAHTFAVAERIRVTVRNASPPDLGTLPDPQLSCSIGLASYPHDGLHARRLLNTAEKHLHQAAIYGDCCCPADAERRRETRRPVSAVVEFQDTSRRQYRQALVLDISRHGIAIGCNAPLEKGSQLTIRFRQPFWPVEHELQGTVRQSGSAYNAALPRFGVEFLQPASELFEPVLFN